MMWADGMLDPEKFHDACFIRSGVYGGAPDYLCKAIDLLPRDIIMCDWHYEIAREFSTIRYLQEKGFDTLGCPRYPINSFLFTRYGWDNRTPRFMGMMATAWVYVNRENARHLKSIVKQNGWIFNNPGEVPEGKPIYQRIVDSCRSAGGPLAAGDFKKVFKFTADGNGMLHSLGSTDMGIGEFPGSGNTIKGRFLPQELDLKPGRQGTIAWQFDAADGHCFERVALKLWYDTVGPTAIEIRVDGEKECTKIDINRNWKGSLLDLTPYTEKTKSIRMNLIIINQSSERRTGLKRFELLGQTIAATDS